MGAVIGPELFLAHAATMGNVSCNTKILAAKIEDQQGL